MRRLTGPLSRLGGGLYGRNASMVNQMYRPIDTTYAPAPVQPSAGLYGPAAAMVDEVYKPIDTTYTPMTNQSRPMLAPGTMTAPASRNRMLPR